MTHRRQDDPEEFDAKDLRGGNPGTPGPWWAKSTWTLGPLAIGFLMLLASVLGWMPQVGKRNGGQEVSAATLKKMIEDHTAQTEVTNRLLRAICRHSAKDERAKEDCDR